MPTVSVIMSVYNSRRFLRPAVESILAQTFRNFELICVDDGSTDDSRAILDEYAAKDDRVRILTRENGGPALAANTGLDAARGELIARLDSDDVALPERLEKQVAFMQAHPDVVLLGSAYDLIDEHDHYLTTFHQPADDAELQRRCLVGLVPIAHAGCMFRREAAIRVGRYRNEFPPSEDIDLYLRLGEIGKMACLPDVLLKYRQHATSLSESRQEIQMTRMRRACEEAWQRRGLTGMTFEGKPWRAAGTRASLYSQHMRFGWWAFRSRSRDAAIYYARRGILLAPWKPEAWKLLACGLFKLGRSGQSSVVGIG